MARTRTHPRPADGQGTAPDRIRAVTQDGYGDADVLRSALRERPVPGPGEVLVRVHAAGLDRGTWHLMVGRPYVVRLVVGLRRPRNPVPGRDVAGTVAAVGPGVTRFAVGDEVFGFGTGTFAEYAVAREGKLARKPSGLSFAQAAVLPVSGVTALQALGIARVAAGQRVLVTGASGGVGSYAVQLAAALGARVTGVASTGKLDLVRSLGAERVVDYTREDFAAGTERYEVIVDVAGNPSPSRLRRALTPTGTAVIVGGEGGGQWTGMGRQLRAVALSPLVKQRLTMFVAKERASDLERLVGFVDAGTLTPALDRTFPLDRAADAMRHLEAGRVRGKVAVTVADADEDPSGT